MATQAAPAPVSRRSGAERLSEQLGGEAHLRILLAKLADAIDAGGAIRLELDCPPGRVMSHRLLKGGPLW